MPVSHRRIQLELGLQKQSYRRVRGELEREGLARTDTEGARALELTLAGRQLYEKQYGGVGRVVRERDLYEPLAHALREVLPDDEVINVGALKRRGQWKNPDVVRVAIRGSGLGFGPMIRVISYEVKPWTNSGWSLPSVYEAAAHARFCHESYLVLEWATDIDFSHQYLDVYGGHLLEACRRFGVGLLVLHPVGKSDWRLERALLASDAHPSEFAVHDYIEHVLSRRAFRDVRDRILAKTAGSSPIESEEE